MTALKLVFILFSFIILTIDSAHAYVHDLPESIIHDVLSESIPSLFAPAPFETSDFDIVWDGPSIPDVEFSLIPKSIQWVRVSNILIFPRARIEIHAKNIESGKAVTSVYSHFFSQEENGSSIASFPIALISGKENPIKLTLLRNGKTISGTLHIKFNFKKPIPEDGLVFYDPSCSQFGVDAERILPPNKQNWIYLSCRSVITKKNADYKASTFEVLLFWDGVGEKINIAGIETESLKPGVWLLRPQAKPGFLDLSSKNQAEPQTVRIKYSIPDPFHSGYIGVGIGPYLYDFNGGGHAVKAQIPLLTIYGSYFITETVRVVAFDATAIHKKWYTDFGLYVPSESFKIFDNRLSFNLLLGGHVIAFNAEGRTHINPGFPQGIELILRDAIFRSYALSLGGFILPKINDQSYYNLWARYGKGGVFGEINYIGWQERASSALIYSRSFGVCIGFPLARFL